MLLSGLDGGVQFAANLVRQMRNGAYVDDGLLERWRALAVVQLFAVQVHLEASRRGGCQRNRDLTVPSSDNLGGQGDRLVPVPSSDAVNDLQLGFAFHGEHSLLCGRVL